MDVLQPKLFISIAFKEYIADLATDIFSRLKTELFFLLSSQSN